jgi:hypothetical protein
MTDFLSWGASWLTEMSNEHASFPVTCSWTVNGSLVSKTINASMVDEEGNVIRADVKARVENTLFMFNTADIEGNVIPLQRGLRIQWDDSVYEVVILGSKSYFYNDVYKQKVVVATKHVLN